jgi:hypothetical protein
MLRQSLRGTETKASGGAAVSDLIGLALAIIGFVIFLYIALFILMQVLITVHDSVEFLIIDPYDKIRRRVKGLPPKPRWPS